MKRGGATDHDRRGSKRKKGEVDASQAKYSFINGLRHVEPYEYVFETYVKRRWVGRPVLEVFVGEFKLYDREYYCKAIADGRITANGRKVCPEYLLSDGELVAHTTRRVEPPVIGLPLRVVQQVGDLVVVDKPGSVPAHPCGQYHFNSVPYILCKENHLEGLHTVHRLDRLTSGILVLAKTKQAAAAFQQKMKEGKVEKRYVARVKGRFPEPQQGASHVVVEQAVRCADPRGSVHECHIDGKLATTKFEMMHYCPEDDTSVVRCFPLTGRTHQIRLHLQWLGSPIANDPCYGGSIAGGVAGEHPAERGAEVEQATSVGLGTKIVGDMTTQDGNGTLHPMGIWLHAYYYQGDDWKFEIDLPSWAGLQSD